MTSRERVLAAFAHVEPDRVPAWCGASTEFWEKAKRALALDNEGLRERLGDNFRRVSARDLSPQFPLSEGATSRTQFGVERRGIGYGQPVSHPLAEATLAEIHAYPWPDPGRMDVSGVRAEAEKHGGEYAILGGEWSPFFHDAIDLLGMENLYLQMYDHPERVDAVLGHLVDYYAEVSRRIFDDAATALDIFFIGNDFGSQRGPLLGGKLFRRFMLPHLTRLIHLGHDYGLKSDAALLWRIRSPDSRYD